MPVDSQIPLQVRPPVIHELDLPRTFLTIAQYTRLAAESQATQARAAREQTVFDQRAGAGQYLRDLGRPAPVAAAPQPGPAYSEADLAALPPGASTPPVATAAPAPARPRTLLDPDVQADFKARFPHVADGWITQTLKHSQDQLTLRADSFEQLARGIPAIKSQADLDAFTLLAQSIFPEVAGRLPKVYSPEAMAPVQQGALSVAAQFEHALKEGAQKIAQQSADTASKAEQRERDRITYFDNIDGTKQAGPTYFGPTSVGGQASVQPGSTIPGTGAKWTPGEAEAAARFQHAARSNARLAVIESEIAALGTDPSTDPTRDAQGVFTSDGINAQTPAEREAALLQYYANTPKRTINEYLEDKTRLPGAGPRVYANNAPDTFTGRGFSRIVPSITEDLAATKAAGLAGTVGSAVGGVAGGAAAAKRGQIIGGTGVQTGSHLGGGVGGAVGENLGNKHLDPRRQQYYGEQLNFITAVRGETLSPDAIALARKQFFPQPGDSDSEIVRKRQVREEELSSLATKVNRQQGMVPTGQTQLPTPGARTYTMEDVRKASQATGRPINEVLADAKRQGVVIR